jgi:hypothetical protein
MGSLDFGFANGNARCRGLASIVSTSLIRNRLRIVLLELALTLMTVGTVVCIGYFEKEKVGKRLVWSTFIVQGFLL